MRCIASDKSNISHLVEQTALVASVRCVWNVFDNINILISEICCTFTFFFTSIKKKQIRATNKQRTATA